MSSVGKDTISEGSKNSYWAISSPEWLQKGWDKVRINGGGPGGDRMTIRQFEANASSRLFSLSRKLREGNYQPGPARRVHIPKKNGETRPLDIPCITDRIVQAGAALYLSPLFEAEFEDSSFAYRPGRGVQDAVQRVARYRREGFSHVVDADIRHFFETVSHNRLIIKLEAIIDDPRVIDLIWTWLEWYRPQGRGLAQGSPISPVLANLYLDKIDEEIAGRGVRLVRYADDFVLLCKGEKTAEAALAHARTLLTEAGLEINENKTRVVSFERGFQFLGHIFMRSLVFQQTALDETPTEDAIEAIQLALRADGQAEKERIRSFDEDFEGAATGVERQDLSLSRRWRTLYVLEPGRRLSVTGEAFSVMEGERRLLGLPAKRVGRIEIGSEVLIDTVALDLAGAHNVQLVRLNGYGAPVGKWVSAETNHAARHVAQFGFCNTPKSALTTARAIVRARVFNQRVFLKRMDRKAKNPEMAETAVKMSRILRRIPHEKDVSALMGREGEAGALYWRMLSSNLPERWRFPTRQRHPASGIGEVALNISVSLLARDIEVAIARRDLHSGVGILHTARNNGDALVYDMMEEFRAPLAEACIIGAIARKQLVPAMFRRSNRTGWSIDRDGYRAIVRAHEVLINRSIKDHVDATRTTWRGLLERQAERFALACEGGEPYKPYLMDY